MKKTVIILMISVLALMLCACATKVTTGDGVTRHKFGHFIEIDKVEYRDEGSNPHTQYLVYDEETKIVYVYDFRLHGTSICPYYVNDINGPRIAIYGKDLYVSKEANNGT